MEWIPILLLVASIVIIFLETILPSMGMLTLLGVACLGGAIAMAFDVSTTYGATVVAIVIVVVPVTVTVGIRMLPRTPWGRRMVVTGTSFTAEEGRGTDRELSQFLGQQGTAETPLRPSGTVVFGERRVSCMTRGEMIDPGALVRAIHVDGNGLVVESDNQ